MQIASDGNNKENTSNFYFSSLVVFKTISQLVTISKQEKETRKDLSSICSKQTLNNITTYNNKGIPALL